MSDRYPPALRDLVIHRPLQPLGPGRPVLERRAALENALLTEVSRVDSDMAQACRAGLWLAYNFLDESHAISQDLSTIEGSYWHALMHRREPDHGNSKYWFRRVGRHAVFAELAQHAARLAATVPEARALGNPAAWDPYAFVDLCERASHGPPALENLCRDLQHREWGLLFDYCFERAVGASSESGT